MKEVIESKGSKVVYDLLLSSNILESCVSVKEIPASDSIGFFPDDTCSNSAITSMIQEKGLEIPTDDCGHYGGIRVGFLNSKGYGELEVLLDFNDLFVYEYKNREVQIDYGRVYKEHMTIYINSLADILNSSKALKGKRMEVDESYKSDSSFWKDV